MLNKCLAHAEYFEGKSINLSPFHQIISYLKYRFQIFIITTIYMLKHKESWKADLIYWSSWKHSCVHFSPYAKPQKGKYTIHWLFCLNKSHDVHCSKQQIVSLLTSQTVTSSCYISQMNAADVKWVQGIHTKVRNGLEPPNTPRHLCPQGWAVFSKQAVTFT